MHSGPASAKFPPFSASYDSDQVAAGLKKTTALRGEDGGSPDGLWYVATAPLRPNTVVAHTVTRLPTWPVRHQENRVPPAAMPNGVEGDLQRYLARWKD